MAQPCSFPEGYFSAFRLQQAEQAFQQAAQGLTSFHWRKPRTHPASFAPSGWTAVWLQNFGFQLFDLLSDGSTQIEYLAFRDCLPSSEEMQLPYNPWGFGPTKAVLLGTSDPGSLLARVQQVPGLIATIFRHINWDWAWQWGFILDAGVDREHFSTNFLRSIELLSDDQIECVISSSRTAISKMAALPDELRRDATKLKVFLQRGASGDGKGKGPPVRGASDDGKGKSKGKGKGPPVRGVAPMQNKSNWKDPRVELFYQACDELRISQSQATQIKTSLNKLPRSGSKSTGLGYFLVPVSLSSGSTDCQSSWYHSKIDDRNRQYVELEYRTSCGAMGVPHAYAGDWTMCKHADEACCDCRTRSEHLELPVASCLFHGLFEQSGLVWEPNWNRVTGTTFCCAESDFSTTDAYSSLDLLTTMKLEVLIGLDAAFVDCAVRWDEILCEMDSSEICEASDEWLLPSPVVAPVVAVLPSPVVAPVVAVLHCVAGQPPLGRIWMSITGTNVHTRLLDEFDLPGGMSALLHDCFQLGTECLGRRSITEDDEDLFQEMCSWSAVNFLERLFQCTRWNCEMDLSENREGGRNKWQLKWHTSHLMIFWRRFCINLPDGIDIMTGHRGVLTMAGAKHMADLIGNNCLPKEYNDCDFLLYLWMQTIALFLLHELIQSETGLTPAQLDRVYRDASGQSTEALNVYKNLFQLLAGFGGRRDVIRNLTVRFVDLCQKQLHEARAALDAEPVPLTAVEQAQVELDEVEDRWRVEVSDPVDDTHPINGFGYLYACTLENAIRSGDGGLASTCGTVARYEHQMQLAINRESEHRKMEQERAASNRVTQIRAELREKKLTLFAMKREAEQDRNQSRIDDNEVYSRWMDGTRNLWPLSCKRIVRVEAVLDRILQLPSVKATLQRMLSPTFQAMIDACWSGSTMPDSSLWGDMLLSYLILSAGDKEILDLEILEELHAALPLENEIGYMETASQIPCVAPAGQERVHNFFLHVASQRDPELDHAHAWFSECANKCFGTCGDLNHIVEAKMEEALECLRSGRWRQRGVCNDWGATAEAALAEHDVPQEPTALMDPMAVVNQLHEYSTLLTTLMENPGLAAFLVVLRSAANVHKTQLEGISEVVRTSGTRRGEHKKRASREKENSTTARHAIGRVHAPTLESLAQVCLSRHGGFIVEFAKQLLHVREAPFPPTLELIDCAGHRTSERAFQMDQLVELVPALQTCLDLGPRLIDTAQQQGEASTADDFITVFRRFCEFVGCDRKLCGNTMCAKNLQPLVRLLKKYSGVNAGKQAK